MMIELYSINGLQWTRVELDTAALKKSVADASQAIEEVAANSGFNKANKYSLSDMFALWEQWLEEPPWRFQDEVQRTLGHV